MNIGEYVNPPKFFISFAIVPSHSPLETILAPSFKKLVNTQTNFAFLSVSPVFSILFNNLFKHCS